jgi:hypothetical protein
MGRRASRFRSLVGGGAWKPPIRVGPSSGTSPTRTRRLFDNSHCVLFFFIEAISHATFSRCPFNTTHTHPLPLSSLLHSLPVPSSLFPSPPFHPIHSTLLPSIPSPPDAPTHVQEAPMPARPPALPVHLLGHDRPGEPALAHVRLRLRPERPCPERQARPVRCSARTPAPAPMATFPNATCTTNISAIANKGKGRNDACGARRDIYGESVIINLWLQPPLFFSGTN